MERAKRLAANPLRVILEASKVKRKVGADPEIVPPTGAVAAVPAAPAMAAAVQPVALNAAAAATVPPAPNPARGDDAPAVARPVPMRTLSASPITGGLGPEMPALAATDKLTLPDAMPLASLAGTASGPVTTPRLIEMVEPAIPARLLDELGRAVEFNADLTLRPDGSVAQVTLVAPVNRTLARYVVAAMERWRFAPLPAEYLHRVQLVFNEGK